jgi:phage baseplate assembly protein gpV
MKTEPGRHRVSLFHDITQKGLREVEQRCGAVVDRVREAKRVCRRENQIGSLTQNWIAMVQSAGVGTAPRARLPEPGDAVLTTVKVRPLAS